MTKEELLELKKKIAKMSEEEQNLRNLKLRAIGLGKEEGEQTGYGSIDKPWLKYYTKESIIRGISDKSIYNFIKSQNINKLDLIAIDYLGRKITYRELFERIDKTAKSFQKIGVQEGDIVTLSVANIPENVISFYALNKIGAVANMIDLRLKGDKLVDAIKSMDSRFLITTDLFLDNLENEKHNLNLTSIIVTSPFDSLPMPLNRIIKLTKNIKYDKTKFIPWNQFENMGKDIKGKEAKVNQEDVACILHTSGTTGNPKRVMLTNKNFNAMVSQYNNSVVTTQEGERYLSQVPPFLAYSALMAIHLPLSYSLRIEMLPNYEPDKFARNIYKLKTKHALAGPADWNNFLVDKKVPKRKYDFITTLGSGSDKLSEESKEDINELLASRGCTAKILEGYGMTEVGSAAVTNLPNHIVPNSVGVPLPKVIVGIFDEETNEEKKYNEIGEICFQGPTMMKGYYNNTEATNETIKKHEDSTLWLHSGDLGYMDENGNIYLKGRLKRLIVRHDGIKISPYDLEKVISKVESVENCCVVGKDDQEHGFGSIPVAAVVLKEEFLSQTDEELEKIMNTCQKQLGEKYIPKEIIPFENLPLTPVGKVNYREVEKIVNSNQQKSIKR